MNKERITEVKEKFARNSNAIRFWDVLDHYFNKYEAAVTSTDKLQVTVEFDNIINELMHSYLKKERETDEQETE